MPDKGFTATFISNTGKTIRQIKVSGWKLHAARVLLALAVLLLSAAVVVIAYGLINAEENRNLRAEILKLQDSLEIRRDMEARLVRVQSELQELREFRQRLENMSTLLPVPEDSTE